jgi:toxin ParE1/3/4
VTGVVFHPLAEQELLEAADFCKTRAVGLGNDFIREVEHMLAQIVASPEAGNILARTIRRWLVRRFPFAILYQAGAENLSMIALMHLRRRPGYWRRRLRDNTKTGR